MRLVGDTTVSIEEAIFDFCENTVDSLIDNYSYELMAAAQDSAMLAGMDETAIMSEFRQAVFESVWYVALYRCDLDTSVVDQNGFSSLSDFSDGQVTDILGTAVSNISEQEAFNSDNTQDLGLEASKIGVTAEIGFSENKYIDEILDRIKERTGNRIFAYPNNQILNHTFPPKL